MQELHPLIAECILEALPGHRCIVPKGDAAVEGDCEQGWRHEGNIFYRQRMFSLSAYGAVDIGQEEELRRLFYARLTCAGTNGHTILVSTAHFTWQGHAAERRSDINLRKAQARRTVAALDAVQLASEPCFFGGDLNEGYWPRIILHGANFVDPFSYLHLPCRPTHPTRPSVAYEEKNTDATLDWLFCRQGTDASIEARSLLASVVQDMVGLSSDNPDDGQLLSVQPSDHCPVLAVYRLQPKMHAHGR